MEDLVMENNVKMIHKIALILVVVGALNWGLIGILSFNLVAALFGDMTIVSRLVYSLVGISSVIVLIKYLFNK
jgi:uncharacterized protein